MTKKHFIQTIIARSLPTTDKRGAALAYGDDWWHWLTSLGYGDSKPGKPRQGADYVSALDARQRYWFDKFWNAYNHKQDRNGAAMRWAQLLDCREEKPIAPDDGFYQFIIVAANKEAQKLLPPGSVRKMAQGWLFEQRYNDFAPTARPKQNRDLELNQLRNELAALKMLHNGLPNAQLWAQIQQKEQALKLMVAGE